ncbi:MAG: hypothetical protein MJ231_01965 [bacterium]|nr:hypothetical protein [bacterium]
MNENITIDTIDIELAKNISKFISNPNIRNRAMANAIAAKISKKYFENYDVDVKSGLHNVSEILERIDISDIYVNGSYIDVRVYFDENECCIPKYNVDNDIVPLAYMFIKLEPELDYATVTGFISSDAVTTCDFNDDFYIIKEDSLTSFYDIEPYIGCEDSSDTSEDIDEAIYDFLDNKLDSDVEFIKTLIHSEQYRLKLINASRAKQIFNFVTISDTTEETDIIDNSTETEDNMLDDNTEDELVLTEPLEEDSLTIDEEDFSLEEVEDTNISTLEPDDLSESEPIETLELQDELQEVSNEEIELDIDTEETDSIINDEENDVVQQSYEPVLDIADETEEISTNEIQEINDSQNVIADITEAVVEVKEDDSIINDLPEEQNSEYTTETTPSIDAYETDRTNANELTEDDLEDAPAQVQESNDESIETLFENKTDATIDNFQEPKNGDKKSSALPIIGVIAVIAGLGYFGYTKYVTSTPSTDTLLTEQNLPQENQVVPDKKVDEAMPIETVENEKHVETKDEGNSLSIPEIERNLGASISVSNLSTQWEVPQSYVANSTATRYLTRMGKVIQLELKTELLLLSKPPITNKIAVEVEYNKAKLKFEVKNITASSGDAAIDQTIKNTVSKVLDTNMNVNMNVFNNMQGNPVLVIRL